MWLTKGGGGRHGSAGFGGHWQASPARETREELAFVFRNPEARDTELGHAHSGRTDNWARGNKRKQSLGRVGGPGPRQDRKD